MAHKHEAEQLWRNMMDNITPLECCQLDGTEYDFYFNLYKFLLDNMPANIYAWGHAKRKAIDIFLKRIHEESSRPQLISLLESAYSHELAFTLYALFANRSTKKKTIALVSYGLPSESYSGFVHSLKQANPDHIYYNIHIIDETTDTNIRNQLPVNTIIFTTAQLKQDTLSTLLSLMQVDCAFVFLSDNTNYDPYYDLSICDTRFIAVHNYEDKSILRLIPSIWEAAWAVIGLNESTSYLDGYWLPKHLTFNYDLKCHLSDLIQSAINHPDSINTTCWYEGLSKANDNNAAKEKLLNLAFSSHELRQQIIHLENIPSCAAASSNTLDTTTAALNTILNEQLHAMERTFSWRITKPLRMIRTVQLSMKNNGWKETLKKVKRRLFK